MILGKKDKYRVELLEATITNLEKEGQHNAVGFLNYLHDEIGLSYASIASTLGVSQQHINNICLGRTPVKNESIYKMLSKLFISNEK